VMRIRGLRLESSQEHGDVLDDVVRELNVKGACVREQYSDIIHQRLRHGDEIRHVEHDNPRGMSG